MAGNVAGGKAAAQTIMKREPDFFKRIGAIGGTRSGTGGFYQDRERARAAGAIGGRRSKRGKRGQ